MRHARQRRGSDTPDLVVSYPQAGIDVIQITNYKHVIHGVSSWLFGFGVLDFQYKLNIEGLGLSLANKCEINHSEPSK